MALLLVVALPRGREDEGTRLHTHSLSCFPLPPAPQFCFQVLPPILTFAWDLVPQPHRHHPSLIDILWLGAAIKTLSHVIAGSLAADTSLLGPPSHPGHVRVVGPATAGQGQALRDALVTICLQMTLHQRRRPP